MQYRTEIFVDDAILTVKVGDRVGLTVGLRLGLFVGEPLHEYNGCKPLCINHSLKYINNLPLKARFEWGSQSPK